MLGDVLGGKAYSLYDIEAFIREAGAERVTEDAVLDLEKELEKLTEKFANRAKIYAQHAGRKRLIKKSDVVLAKGVFGSYSKPYAFIKKASKTNASSISER